MQRAVKADLSLLQLQFQADLEQYNSASNESQQQHGDSHDSNGYRRGMLFQVFKQTFQRTRFGIIHLRCCPPRCDRGEYLQLVYSTVLGMLRDCFHNEQEADRDHDRDHDMFLCHATFAIFALYTIYETNPLPPVPTMEQGPKQILSTLPMGASSEHGGRRSYRRSYRAAIRISQDLYSCIQRLRDLALVRMDACLQHELDDTCRISDWKCCYGLAGDCIHVIDRLLQGQAQGQGQACCIQLCEYSGPASLEGLAGSEEYYHCIVLKEEEELTLHQAGPNLATVLATYANANANANTNIGDAGRQQQQNIDASNRLLDGLEFDQFEESMQSHHARYHDILGNVASDLARNNTASRPSRQLQSIQQTLGPILDRRQKQRERGGVGGCLLDEVKAYLCGRSLDESGNNEESREGGVDTAMVAIANVVPALTQNELEESVLQNPIQVSCPLAFSNGLKDGIEQALKSVLEAVVHIRSNK